MNPFLTLKPHLDYLPSKQVEEVCRAYQIAEEAHQGQKRSSGEAYISHPVEVACLLASMRMDWQSIVAALLHDVLEDTHVTKADIVDEFGKEVADLVDGVSKLQQIEFASRAQAQAENLRKMILAMTRDIRVILIKLADRLHNMRTLSCLPLEKRRRISKETLEVYAPIANRLGMNSFRIEFEDLGFSFLYPMRYRVLKESVRKARGNRKEVVEKLELTLREKLEKEEVGSFRVVGREKHLYSLYNKMKTKNLSLSEIMDIYAIRILVTTVDACYRVLGIIHNFHRPIHGRFKDYIAVPKANGYQSLHTAILGPYGIPIEVQIRTEEMHRMAENGIAAHWLYKNTGDAVSEAEVRASEWLKGILEIQKTAGDTKEFIEHVKVDLYPTEVYVFTPEGDILSLPEGATAVDFAYAVHTDVGNTCIACKIDRRLSPLSSRLGSGQTVEIITAVGAQPNPAWLGFVTTGKARSNIRHWLKNQKIEEARALGKRFLDRALSTLSLSLDDIPTERAHSVLVELNLTSVDDLHAEIGIGNQLAPLIVRRLVSEESVPGEPSVYPLAIRGTEGMVISYAKCCYPIPGDAIIGFLSAGRGVVVHREECRNLSKVYKHTEKYVSIRWEDKVSGEFKAKLRVEALNERGILANLASHFAELGTNIQDISIDELDTRHNVMTFILSVHNRDHVAKIIRIVRAIPAVTRVIRET